MFISFEGLDFSGKSTQARRLVERLQNVPLDGGRPPVVHFIREPGGTTISERVRAMLLDKEHLEMTSIAELLLFSASRAQLVEERIRPALVRGETVVCDRYCDSTTAYQGYGRGIPLETVLAINRAATSGTMPEVTIVVDIPVEEIARRKDRAGVAFDRMESSGMAFYERVRKGYRLMAEQEERFAVVDGTRSMDQVEEEIWRLLVHRAECHEQRGRTQ